MRTPVFTGMCPALVTPFYESGAINFTAFGAQIERQLAAGADALCVCGTTGEASTLSLEERDQLISCCVQRTAHRAKVIAGTGSNDTAAAVEASRHARQLGADALLVVTPYYNKTTQIGLVRHYERIADQADLPVILYNVPSRTGMSFAAETYRELARNPNINGVKEASGSFPLFTRTLAVCPPDFTVWCGNDDLPVPMMALGAKGVISASANVIPDVMVQLARLCLSGRFREAADLQIGHSDLLDALFAEVNPIPIKAAMNLLELEAGPLRAPLCDPSEATLLRLSSLLADKEIL